MTSRRSRTEILVSVVAAFHAADIGASLPADMHLTSEEFDLGVSIIETDYDCDVAAAARALAQDPNLASFLG